jgi:hypothetical protein
MVHIPGFRVQGLEFEVQSLGSMVEGSWSRFLDPVFRVED